MIVTVSHVFHGNKCSYINFQRSDAPDVFYNVALAFPTRWVGEKPVQLGADEFRSALSVGSEVNIRWSKKLSAYVVRF